ncbi:DNA-deoxyinosine glycosylase [Lachnospiraceae bacterium MD1]|uniref:DNA-deoxyinosine glycosylase n=1 Tax=Variimorphobacter saccharofermentans TaxID=2755051 RepID=A0A839K5C6_9FIRM|nr:DNA-deoxyinosine glycosylase [Variimorphobacter saccharofermentans]MBB2184537.1 DNA-deoxyinosine glycosylase [Variimorphobacter saccharofermentans]
MSRIIHPIPPIYNKDSKRLILGSFPSVKSREGEFFYHHPQNRFWKVISTVFEEPLPESINEKKEMLLRNGIAIWDVIQSCEIKGSADSSIKNVIPNDLSLILENAKIQHIYTNGATSYRLYMKYIYPVNGISAVRLPSTSPANAAFGMERLVEAWSCLRYPMDMI